MKNQLAGYRTSEPRKSFLDGYGLTLVEVLVVIAVLAILLAIAIPAIMAWTPNMRLRAGAQDLLVNMQRAKIEAIKRRSSVTLTFAPVAACPGGSYTFTDTSGAIVANVAMSNGLCLRALPAPAPVVVPASAVAFGAANFPAGEGFTPRGLPISGTATNKGIVLTQTGSTSVFILTETIEGGIVLERF